MKNIKYLIVVIELLLGNYTFSQNYNILHFGAKIDSTFLNTKAIQGAIDKCFLHGGGEDIVPAGRCFSQEQFS